MSLRRPTKNNMEYPYTILNINQKVNVTNSIQQSSTKGKTGSSPRISVFLWVQPKIFRTFEHLFLMSISLPNTQTKKSFELWNKGSLSGVQLLISALNNFQVGIQLHYRSRAGGFTRKYFQTKRNQQIISLEQKVLQDENSTRLIRSRRKWQKFSL